MNSCIQNLGEIKYMSWSLTSSMTLLNNQSTSKTGTGNLSLVQWDVQTGEKGRSVIFYNAWKGTTLPPKTERVPAWQKCIEQRNKPKGKNNSHKKHILRSKHWTVLWKNVCPFHITQWRSPNHSRGRCRGVASYIKRYSSCFNKAVMFKLKNIDRFLKHLTHD